MEISPSPVRHHQSAAALNCPRCHSANTKFCYYNNYSLSQPRHFCKACKRYWTRGGTLRNVPVGGGCRKNKPVLVKKAPQPTTATKLAPAHDDPLQLPLDLPSSTSSTSSAISIHYNSTDSSVLLVNSLPTLPSANFHGRPSCTGIAFDDQYQLLHGHLQPPERATLLGHEEQQLLQQRTNYEEIDAGAEWRISTENYNNSSSQILSLQNDCYSSPNPYLKELAGIGGRMLKIDGRRAAAHLI